LICFPLIPLKKAGLAGQRKTNNNMLNPTKNVVHKGVFMCISAIFAAITL